MRLMEVKAAFIVSVGEYQVILLTKHWSDFLTNVMKLLSLLEQAIVQIEKNALKAQKQRE
jgi:hypothetical protein